MDEELDAELINSNSETLLLQTVMHVLSCVHMISLLENLQHRDL